MQVIHIKQWVKRQEHPAARLSYRLLRGNLPYVAVIHRPLYKMHIAITTVCAELLRRCYYTPLFQSRLTTPCKQLYLYAGMPYITGGVEISVGQRCRISGKTTISGRSASSSTHLCIGNNCDIGWQNTIAVGTSVKLGNNVRLAGNVFLAGYPGHPIDAQKRAEGQPCTDNQIGDIVLEDDVWLATGVTVLAGVRIGQGSIIGAGSVVTHNIPAGVIAAGSPAKVIRELSHG